MGKGRTKNIFKRISKATFLFAFFIIISASFMRQVMNFVKGYTGLKNFRNITGLILVILGLALFIFRIKKSRPNIKTLIFALVLILGIALSSFMKIPEERIHIIEYGILGWLIMRDLAGIRNKWAGVICAFLFTAFVGYSDELFQKFLPYRVYDLRDIVFNSIGGIWGICLYLLN